jgi:hypothetical protein
MLRTDERDPDLRDLHLRTPLWEWAVRPSVAESSGDRMDTGRRLAYVDMGSILEYMAVATCISRPGHQVLYCGMDS